MPWFLELLDELGMECRGPSREDPGGRDAKAKI